MQRETRNLTKEECAQVVLLQEEGYSYRIIGERYGVSHTTISRIIRRYRETGNHSRRRGQGRHRATTRVHDRFVRLCALRQRFVTCRSLQAQLQEVHGLEICTETVRKRLREDDLLCRIPARCPMLTVHHRRDRLNFARNHVNWLEDNWAQILFTDESRFCLHNCDRRIRVYRRPNERYAQCNITNTTLFGGGSLMVWGVYL